MYIYIYVYMYGNAKLNVKFIRQKDQKIKLKKSVLLQSISLTNTYQHRSKFREIYQQLTLKGTERCITSNLFYV